MNSFFRHFQKNILLQYNIIILSVRQDGGWPITTTYYVSQDLQFVATRYGKIVFSLRRVAAAAKF